MAKISKQVKTKKLNMRITKMFMRRTLLAKKVKETGDISSLFILSKTRNYSIVRQKNRCKLTGKPRAYIGYFGLCRNAVRYVAMLGFLPGLKKV